MVYRLLEEVNIHDTAVVHQLTDRVCYQLRDTRRWYSVLLHKVFNGPCSAEDGSYEVIAELHKYL